MKTKMFKYGPHKCKAYFKPVGKGWEVGFHFGPHPIFVGNFVHKKEANEWWTKMNREWKAFATRYALAPGASVVFYRKFLANHFYNMYYKFLDSKFTTYERTYTRAVVTDMKKYKKMKEQNGWKPADKFKVKHAA